MPVMRTALKSIILAGVLVVLLGAPAWTAPAGGGAGGRGGFFEDPEAVTPTWSRHDLKTALGENKFVLLYVHPVSDPVIPTFFRHADIATASRSAFVFVRMPFKAGDPLLKELNVTAAPAVLGLDPYGNEWRRATSYSQNGVKDILRAVPEDVSRYVEALDRSLAQAKAREEKGDDRGAVQVYRRLALETRRGYEQIVVAREKAAQLGDRRLRDAIAGLATNERTAVEALEYLVREGGDTQTATGARLALLRHALDQGAEVRSRLPEIQKIADLPGEDVAPVAKEAQALLASIEIYADSLVVQALRKAKRGETDAAKALLRRVASDFAGTKAAKQAADEVSRL
jgi:hypothetical protein